MLDSVSQSTEIPQHFTWRKNAFYVCEKQQV